MSKSADFTIIHDNFGSKFTLSFEELRQCRFNARQSAGRDDVLQGGELIESQENHDVLLILRLN